MQIDKLSPDTPIVGLEHVNIVDFWSWAYSDILVNTNRSVMAEFLVGSALGVITKPRIEWDECDLIYREKKIEVKCSAYIQSWKQDELSKIVFDIAKKMAWDARTNTIKKEPIRVSDCYVFCLYTEKNKESATILDLSFWEFYVVNTTLLTEQMGDQKRIGLARLSNMCKPVKIDRLKESIDKELGILPEGAY